jgi:hypothetical protein
MTLYEYSVDGPSGRQYFKDIKQANEYAQKVANETQQLTLRRDVYGGSSTFRPSALKAGIQ